MFASVFSMALIGTSCYDEPCKRRSRVLLLKWDGRAISVLDGAD